MPSKTTDSECSSYLKFTLSLISLALISFPALADEVLDQVNVVAESPVNSTAGNKGYTIKSMNTATGLRISGKDTPQSVSVVNRSV